MFTTASGALVHPHAISQTFARVPDALGCRPSDCTTSDTPHGTLLIAAGVPAKVVSERLGHAWFAFTVETYQHVLPGMQTRAARMIEALISPGVPPVTPEQRKAG